MTEYYVTITSEYDNVYYVNSDLEVDDLREAILKGEIKSGHMDLIDSYPGEVFDVLVQGFDE